MIITRGSRGAEYKGITYPVEEVDVRDTSGAGDTFLTGLVYGYLDTNSIYKGIKFAQECTTIVVQKHGVSTV